MTRRFASLSGLIRAGDPRVLGPLLFLVTAAVYLPSIGNGFINCDDPRFITENPFVQRGFSRENIHWAFTSLDGGFWHPLSWLSLMLDCQVFGLRAGGMHLTSLLLHAANAVVLFLVLRRMTRAPWRSALVAGLFALHPLHVESVAWAFERKDVLSTLFFLLTIWAYVRYAEVRSAKCEVRNPTCLRQTSARRESEGNPNSEVQGAKAARSSKSKASAEQTGTGQVLHVTQHVSRFTVHVSLSYVLALVFFALALMSKTMVVTLPIVLLLLDWWPLGRVRAWKPAGLSAAPGRQARMIGHLLLEKAPFFGAAFVCGLLTMRAQRGVGALLTGAQDMPIASRLCNAFLSYVSYLAQTVWPTNLAFFYPPLAGYSSWAVGGAAMLVLAISMLVLLAANRAPHLAVGWLWYAVTLLPVSGVIQVGAHYRADRFTYVPLTGIFVMLVWGLGALWERWHRLRPALVAGAGLSLAACALLTVRQLHYWRDSELLYRHALAVTRDNFVAYDNLATYLWANGRTEEAMEALRQSLAIRPHPSAMNSLGAILGSEGRHAEAIECFKAALQTHPLYAEALNNLGATLARIGKPEDAIKEYEAAVRVQPREAKFHHNLAVELAKVGKAEQAIQHYETALRLRPGFVPAHAKLAEILVSQKKFAEAIPHYYAALLVWSNRVDLREDLACALADAGRLDEAVGQCQLGLQANSGLLDLRNNLGVFLRMQGNLGEAIEQFRQVLRADTNHAGAQANLNTALAAQGRIARELAEFRDHVRLKPDDPQSHYSLGRSLLDQPQFEEAVAELKTSLRLDPRNSDAHYYLGVALLRQGKRQEALVQFREALRLKPDFSDARRQLEISKE